ncbi:MAG: hypothetical protein GQ526_01980 [Ardenticatenales bacterium]|nr:hypothetical protein [Ardenticatenales bacterium]
MPSAASIMATGRAREKIARGRARVEAGRELPAGTDLTCHAGLGPAEIQDHCWLDRAGKQLVRSAMQQLATPCMQAFHHT